MNDRALRYFLAVVRAGSIRGAADALNVAASAVSRQIIYMETTFGQPLLERLPRGVVPTQAGLAVAEHAQRQAEEAELLHDRLRRLRGGEDGTVRICCGPGFLADLLDNGLAGFGTANPGIDFRVMLGGTDRVLAAVAEGEVDLGLAYNPPSHPDLRSAAIARQPLAAILAPGYPIASHEPSMPLRQLAREPLALLPEGHGVRQLLGRVEADGGFRLRPRLESGSIELLRRFAVAGMGITFLPEFAAAAELAEGRLIALPMAEAVLAEASAHLLVRAQRTLPQPADRLVTWLKSHLVAYRPSHGIQSVA